MNRTLVLLALTALSFSHLACKKKGDNPAQTEAIEAMEAVGAKAAMAHAGNAHEQFGKVAASLMESLGEPKEALHFSYKAQAQINPKFPREAGSKPEIGPITMEAHVSPDTISIESLRGTKKSSHKAKSSDPMTWAFAKMPLIGAPAAVGLHLAFAAPSAKSSDGVHFTFDSRAQNTAENAGLAMAQALLQSAVKVVAIYGWLEADGTTGRMKAFNFDVELADKAGFTWKEHHEGTLRPE